jgi:hypothetical protein
MRDFRVAAVVGREERFTGRRRFTEIEIHGFREFIVLPYFLTSLLFKDLLRRV